MKTYSYYQYSLYRILFAMCISALSLSHCFRLLTAQNPSYSPKIWSFILLSLLGLLTAFEWKRKIISFLVAVPLTYVILHPTSNFFSLSPPEGTPFLIYLGLLWNICIPSSTSDQFFSPEGEWKMSSTLFALIWFSLAVLFCLFSVAATLYTQNFLFLVPCLGLLLVMVKTLRFFMWMCMLVVNGTFLLLFGSSLSQFFIILSFSVLLFDPRWLPGAPSLLPESRPIIFYDGECGLCNRFVDFILRVDNKNYFLLASLQGQTAAKKLPKDLLENPTTLVLWTGNQSFFQSEAVLTVLSHLGGIWRIIGLLQILPSFILDRIYQFYAKNRYFLFGRAQICRLPKEEEKSKFLP